MTDLWADDETADDRHGVMVENRNEFERRHAELAQELGHAPSADQVRALWDEIHDEGSWGNA